MPTPRQASRNRPPTDPTGRLAASLAGGSELAPDDVRLPAGYLILDGIGCALVGAKLPWSRLAVESITAFEGAGNATRGIASPLSGEGVVTKFRTLTDDIVASSRARQIERMVLDLEDRKDVRTLVDLLAPPVAAFD